MADKGFGVREVNLIGATGTPFIESPNNLDIKAINVAISTDMSVGGDLTVTGEIIGISSINVTGIITASNFVGDGSGLTNITATGTGIGVSNNTVTVGTASTLDFGTNLSVTPASAGIVTITATDTNTTYTLPASDAGSGNVNLTLTGSDASTDAVLITAGTNVTIDSISAGGFTINAAGGGALQSRELKSGTTASLAPLAIGNITITGFKSYALMNVGLSTAGWLRLYTDSASRTADAGRSIGEDPTPGSGVIAEVVTTGLSTSQNIAPFVIGGNMNDPVDTDMYVAITNTSGQTQTITANLTILKLED